MFGSVRHLLQLSAASVVVQNLFEQQKATGLFDIDPKALSSKVVALAFGERPDLINGQKGPKPHKISMAAVSLAQGMREFDEYSDEYKVCFFSLGVILMEMEANGGSYPLTGKDAQFLELARREYLNHEFNDDLGVEELFRATASDVELHDRKAEIRDRLQKLGK